MIYVLKLGISEPPFTQLTMSGDSTVKKPSLDLVKYMGTIFHLEMSLTITIGHLC